MNIIEVLFLFVQVLFILLLLLMGLVLHRIGTIRKWEIEKEREEMKNG